MEIRVSLQHSVAGPTQRGRIRGGVQEKDDAGECVVNNAITYWVDSGQ